MKSLIVCKGKLVWETRQVFSFSVEGLLIKIDKKCNFSKEEAKYSC